VVHGSGADLMLQFWFEKGGNKTKCCHKMKRMQRACLGSMGRKCDRAWRRGDIDKRRGNIGEEKGRRGRQLVSYPGFMPKSSTHRMHDPGSIVPHMRPKIFTDNQIS
jgi:hypothetical protein